MLDFIQIVNRIFINKNSYKEISDEDKINSFFIINRKFGKQYPEIARKFNHKDIDKASAIDLWFDFFRNEHKIPQWYWDNKNLKKNNYNKFEKNYKQIQIKEELKEIEIDFLKKYFFKELNEENKKIEKIDN